MGGASVTATTTRNQGRMAVRDAVWAAKRAALEAIAAVPLTGQRLAAYQRFREREGRDLDDWAAW